MGVFLTCLSVSIKPLTFHQAHRIPILPLLFRTASRCVVSLPHNTYRRTQHPRN
ncbi:hypothetical protein O5D80_000290 [Batrachochytrium dendrobatidis]|nr:hypothetical protein O5D80_000290 [Batrachochytrium dendrobatidis]